MFIIAEEDMPVVEQAVNSILNTVASGVSECHIDVDVGDGICPIVVSGYWVVDTIRIDIRIKK